MKQVILAVLTMMMLVSGGCGGDVTLVASTGNGTIVVTTETAPAITLAQYRQDTTNRLVLGTIDFYSPVTDLSTMVTSVTNSKGALISRSVNDLSAFSGLSRGSVPFTIDYLAFPPDAYTFTIFVTNVAGYLSNPVFGTFAVL